MTTDQIRSKSCPICGMTFTAQQPAGRVLAYKMASHTRGVHRKYWSTRLIWNAVLGMGGAIGLFVILFSFLGVCSSNGEGCTPPIVKSGTDSSSFVIALGTYLTLLVVGILMRKATLERIRNSWDQASQLETPLPNSNSGQMKENTALSSTPDSPLDSEARPSDYFTSLAEKILDTRTENLSPDYYFEGLAQRLTERGFQVQRQVQSDPYTLDLYAVGPGIPRGKGGGTIAVLGVGIPAATTGGVGAFSSFAMNYINENKKTLGLSTFDLDVLPIIAAEEFPPEVVAWVSENRPYQKAITDTFVFPVLVSTRTGEVYCFKKTPFMGGLHYGVLRKWAAKHIGFQNPLTPSSS